MKLIYESYGTRYTVETNRDDLDGAELKEIFSKIMVQAGFPPSVVDLDDGGKYEYVGEDEIVIKQEKLDELEEKAARYNDLCE